MGTGLSRRIAHWAVPLFAALGVLSTVPLPANAAPIDPVPGPRVVNGRPAEDGEFGFLVALGDRSTYERYGFERAQFCGGTLAAPNLVITAAHCVHDTTARNVVVGSPGPDGALSSGDMLVSNVSAIKVNPLYRPSTQSYDVAVLTLSTPLRGVPTLTPVTAKEAQTLTASRAPVSVAGWGATNANHTKYPDVFQVGELVVFPESTCGGGEPFVIDGVRFDGYDLSSVDPRTMLCAEGVADGTPVDSCVGDSGGPLVGGTGTDRRLVGIVSWGLNDCATRRGAGVYSRVSAFTDFLKGAGVPYDNRPGASPQPPTITDTSTTATTITVTVAPFDVGAQPDSYSISARGPDGHLTSCSVAAPTRPATATCTIKHLQPGTQYVVTAIAINEASASDPSASVTVTPAGAPGRPVISDYMLERGGIAAFLVSSIRNNGSPLISKRVRCLAPDGSRRSAPITSGGIALVKRLTTAVSYRCTATVTNAFGSASSAAVTFTAK